MRTTHLSLAPRLHLLASSMVLFGAMANTASAITLLTQDFEGTDFDNYVLRDNVGNTYTQFFDSGSDRIFKTNNPAFHSNAPTSLTITGTTGNFIILEDVGGTNGTPPFTGDLGYMDFDPINVSGATSMSISFSVATPNNLGTPASGTSSTRYETGDHIKLQYSHDGTNYTDAISISGVEGQPFMYLNGDGSSTQVNENFQNFSASIGDATGPNLHLRVEFSSGVQEEIAFDNVKLDAVSIPEPSSSLLVLFSFCCCMQRRR